MVTNFLFPFTFLLPAPINCFFPRTVFKGSLVSSHHFLRRFFVLIIIGPIVRRRKESPFPLLVIQPVSRASSPKQTLSGEKYSILSLSR